MDKFELLFNINTMVFDVYGKLLTIKRHPFIGKKKNLLKRNMNLKKQRKTDKCFIIGLGPSLKEIDIEKLDSDIIVTNRYYKVTGSEATKPVAYVINDDAYFAGDSISDFQQAVKTFPDSNFILNGAYSNEISKLFVNMDNFYYLFLWDGFPSLSRKEIDLTKILPMSSNVVVTALYTAIYMGYKEIYLLGCDFNSFASQKAVHAYAESNDARKWTMTTELFQYSFAAEQHKQINLYAERLGIKIWNMTECSLIDAYDRKKADFYKKK